MSLSLLRRSFLLLFDLLYHLFEEIKVSDIVIVRRLVLLLLRTLGYLTPFLIFLVNQVNIRVVTVAPL